VRPPGQDLMMQFFVRGRAGSQGPAQLLDRYVAEADAAGEIVEARTMSIGGREVGRLVLRSDLGLQVATYLVPLEVPMESEGRIVDYIDIGAPYGEWYESVVEEMIETLAPPRVLTGVGARP
jgi:hypothetical protein